VFSLCDSNPVLRCAKSVVGFIPSNPEAADHIIYQANNYSKWLSAAGLQTLSEHLQDHEQLRKSGLLQVLASDAAVEMIRTIADGVRLTHFYSWTLLPGLPLNGHRRILSCSRPR
jgi:hypothetical protein